MTPELFGVDMIRGGELAGIELGQNVPYYFLSLVFALLAILVAKNLLRSRTGRAFAAIRDHDIAAGVVGVNVFAAKTRAFVISSAMTGVAGALLGGFYKFVTFEQWDLLLSIQYLAMIVLGGLGTVVGAVLGAVFVTALPEIVDGLSGVLGFVSQQPGFGLTSERLSTIVYGLLIAGVMVLEPLGLYGLWIRVRRYFSFWPFRH
ncbi:MAG: branched-chain amino acid ABC transporter permease [Acidimicrobiia bacterium]|nr:branched-chain amino acid ABC transporter permease [Acidimicrobiia bacterium]